MTFTIIMIFTKIHGIFMKHVFPYKLMIITIVFTFSHDYIMIPKLLDYVHDLLLPFKDFFVKFSLIW